MVEAPTIEKDKKEAKKPQVAKNGGKADIGSELAAILRGTLQESGSKKKDRQKKGRKRGYKEKFEPTQAASELFKKREKVVSTNENIEDARLNLKVAREAVRTEIPHRRTVFSKSLKEKEKDNERLMGIALKEQEESLLELNSHLYKLVNTGTPEDDSRLFDRYIDLFDELKELHGEKIKNATSLNERVSLLSEYEVLLSERVNVCIELAEARGFELIAGRPEEKNLVTVDGKHTSFKVREIDSSYKPDIENAQVSFVEMIKEQGEVDYRTTAVGVKLFKDSEFKVDEYIQKWKALKEAEVPVSKVVMKDENANTIYLSDLSMGAKFLVYDYEYLALFRQNHGGLPRALRKKKKAVIDTLVNCAERASNVGYYIKPEALRFVTTKDKVKVFIFDLFNGIERQHKIPVQILEENINTIRKIFIDDLALVSEEEWNKYNLKYSVDERPQPEKKAA